MQTHMLTRGVMLMVVLGLCVLTGWLSSAEAVITIKRAEVVNGAAVVEGGNAARSAPIFWEGARVTQANNGGNFAFQGVVPADCVGRLEDGVPADAIDVALANCVPVSGAPALVPQTGQTQCWDPADTTAPIALIDCSTPAAMGQGGAVRAGVPFPTPRFTDNGNGTVTDNLTGLIWLKNASCVNCFGTVQWANTLNWANSVASGSCGLSDGSIPGDWRLPNVREMHSLIDFGQIVPALPVGHPFINVQLDSYWTSTSRVDGQLALVVETTTGQALYVPKNPEVSHICAWPVRGGD